MVVLCGLIGAGLACFGSSCNFVSAAPPCPHDTPLEDGFQSFHSPGHHEVVSVKRAPTLLTGLTVHCACHGQQLAGYLILHSLSDSLYCIGFFLCRGPCATASMACPHMSEHRARNTCRNVAHDCQVVLQQPAQRTHARAVQGSGSSFVCVKVLPAWDGRAQHAGVRAGTRVAKIFGRLRGPTPSMCSMAPEASHGSWKSHPVDTPLL